MFKKIDKNDCHFLKEMLYEAIFVPPGEKPYPKTIIDLPEISKYVENFGRVGDYGLIAEADKEKIGAIWARLFPFENKGYGYIDAYTPEISMALRIQNRSKGIGTKLLNDFFKISREMGFKTLSLSVDKRNSAFNLYKRVGFIVVSDKGASFVMRKNLEM